MGIDLSEGGYGYTDLKAHIGHKLVCVGYGDKDDPINIAIECEDCNEVLVDFEKSLIETGWEDKHSVNCYFCNKLVDERETLPADKYNGNDGGSICMDCQKKYFVSKLDNSNLI